MVVIDLPSLIGAHGAGLMHVMFMAEEGVLVEIHPLTLRPAFSACLKDV